jgi:hypothetical protein
VARLCCHVEYCDCDYALDLSVWISSVERLCNSFVGDGAYLCKQSFSSYRIQICIERLRAYFITGNIHCVVIYAIINIKILSCRMKMLS